MTEERDISRFIDNTIESMKGTVPYVINEMNECEDPDKTARWWREWALAYNRLEYDKAFGALLYANCYQHEISDIEYDYLLDKVYEAHRTEERHIWEGIK